jgi:hypothetical protein
MRQAVFVMLASFCEIATNLCKRHRFFSWAASALVAVLVARWTCFHCSSLALIACTSPMPTLVCVSVKRQDPVLHTNSCTFAHASRSAAATSAAKVINRCGLAYILKPCRAGAGPLMPASFAKRIMSSRFIASIFIAWPTRLRHRQDRTTHHRRQD